MVLGSENSVELVRIDYSDELYILSKCTELVGYPFMARLIPLNSHMKEMIL